MLRRGGESMFLVLSIVEWDELELSNGMALGGVHPRGSYGFAPIFSTREDAEVYANGKQVLEVRYTSKP